jgi:hypothetical protein
MLKMIAVHESAWPNSGQVPKLIRRPDLRKTTRPTARDDPGNINLRGPVLDDYEAITREICNSIGVYQVEKIRPP